MTKGILSILHKFVDSFEFLTDSLNSVLELDALLFHYGWNTDITPTNFEPIRQVFIFTQGIKEITEKIETLTEKEDFDDVNPEEIYQLIELTDQIIRNIIQLKDIEVDGLPFPFSERQFWKEISERILEDVVTMFLKKHYPLAFGLLHFFGIILFEEEQPEGEGRINYTRTYIHWDRLGDLLSGPHILFKEIYQWNQEGKDFQWEKFLHALEYSFLANRFLVRYNLPRRSVIEAFSDPDYMVEHQLHELQIPFIYGSSILDESFYNIGLALMPIGRNGSMAAPDGLLITPLLEGDLSQKFLITPEVRLNLDAAVSADNVVGIQLFPDQVDLATNGSATEISARIGLEGTPYPSWIIAGSHNSHRLELHGFELFFMVSGEVSDPEVKIGFHTKGAEEEEGKEKSHSLQLVIQMDESDGFLQDNVSKDKIEAGFDLEIEWSSKSGFRFGGTGSFELQLALNRKLGPIEFRTLYLRLGESKTRDDRKSISLRAGVGIKGQLGPVMFLLDNMGFSADLIPYSKEDLDALPPEAPRPKLGLFDLDMGFAPPKGMAISIDAKAVKGGGALFFDRDKGEYAGVAELTVKNTISVKAVGIITTKLPDGSSGYSFLLFISAEFPPLQLGFGFTLNGVGGLVGIHRTMNPPFLQKGVRDKTLDDILFPEDPVKNAPRIISSLGQAFPVQPGQYIFGLMGIIGWGPKGLLSLELGLMIEVPDPLRFAILGVLKLSIKRDTLSIAHLQVNFIGIIDFDNKFLSFDASLYNSTLLAFRLEGDIALRVNWGAESFFLLSVGGFHPAFNDLPPDFPAMKRMRLSLVDQKAMQLSFYFYLAVTSNTFQIGAGVLLNVQVWKFRIIGEFTFDALFHSLTNFMVNVSLTIAIMWGSRTLAGIAFKGQLTGTSPWNIQGEATFSFAIWPYTARFNKTFGDALEEEQSGIELLPELKKELEDVRNWQQLAPSKSGQLVTLRKVQLPEEDSAASFLVHPTGGVAVRQSLLPLNIRLDKFGSQKPADYQRYQLELQDTAGQTLSGRAEKDLFAPAQYLEMNDEEKLSRKSYERFAAGVAMSGSEGITCGNSRQRSVAYEQRVYDSWEVMVAAEIQAFAEESSPFQANLAVAGSDLGRSHAYEEGGYRVQEEEFMLVYENNQEVPLPGIPPFASETEALQYLEELEDRDPGTVDQLMIISTFEMS